MLIEQGFLPPWFPEILSELAFKQTKIKIQINIFNSTSVSEFHQIETSLKAGIVSHASLYLLEGACIAPSRWKEGEEQGQEQIKRTARGRRTHRMWSLHLPHHLVLSLHKHLWGRSQWTLNFVADRQSSLLWYFLVGPQCHFWSFFQFTILSSAKAQPAYSRPLILAQTFAWVNSFFFFLRSLQKISLVASSLQDSYPCLSIFFFFETRQVSAISPAQ